MTASDIALEKILTHYNLTMNDIQAIDMSPATMAAALTNGDIDGYVIWQPISYNGTKLVGADNITQLNDTEDIYTRYISLFADESYISSHTDTVKKVLIALKQAESFAQTNQSESQSIVAELLSMPLEVVESLWSTYGYKVWLRSTTVGDLDFLLSWAAVKKWFAGTLPSATTLIHEVK